MSAQHTPGVWKVKPVIGFSTGKPIGFTVERVNAARNGFDLFHGGYIYRTEEAARAAIAKATGAQP